MTTRYAKSRPDRRMFLDAAGMPVIAGATYTVRGLEKTLGVVCVTRLLRVAGAPHPSDGAAICDTVIVRARNAKQYPVFAKSLVPANAKIQGRGFDTRFKRKLDGSVERR